MIAVRKINERNMSPKFSVLMANYNKGQNIQEAIESVINQTFPNWELLIMDDGSTDNSIDKIKEYLEDDRIFLIKNSINKGKVACLLDLVNKSRAEFFGILDSDDMLNEQALSCMYDAHVKHQNCGFIYSQFEFCDSSMNPICHGFCRPLPQGETNLRDIYSSAFRTFKKVYYKMTDGYNEKFIYGQDRDIVLKMEEVTNFLFVNKVLYKHVDNFINRIESFLPHKIKLSHPTEKLYKLGQILSHSSLQSTYQRLVSVINEPDDFIIKGSPSETLIDNLDIWHTFDENVTTMQYIDLMTYHPDDILVKVDRAAMAVSLETRLPYLDHEIVKFATSLPLNKRFRNGQGKWLLRQVLYRYVPETLIERPKMGFGVPIGDWIKGPLRGWAEPLINQERLTREGYFNTQTVSDMWMQHISGGYNRTHELWNILMFQSWLESNK
jgi:glycosyltransferase involved in cell wall biosynthesis